MKLGKIHGIKKNHTILISLFLSIALNATDACANVKVVNHVMYKGIYYDGSCMPDENDSCERDMDIEYPELQGILDKAQQKKINQLFKSAAKKAAKSISNELLTREQEKRIHPTIDDYNSEVITDDDFTYETVFNSDKFVSFEFDQHIMWQGAGSNQDTGPRGVLVDVASGRILMAKDVFNPDFYQQASEYASAYRVKQCLEWNKISKASIKSDCQGLYGAYDDIELPETPPDDVSGRYTGSTLSLGVDGIHFHYADGSKTGDLIVVDKSNLTPTIQNALSQTK